MTLTRENRSTRTKTCPSAIVHHKSHTELDQRRIRGPQSNVVTEIGRQPNKAEIISVKDARVVIVGRVSNRGVDGIYEACYDCANITFWFKYSIGGDT
jgi:hypothetical protein